MKETLKTTTLNLKRSLGLHIGIMQVQVPLIISVIPSTKGELIAAKL